MLVLRYPVDIDLAPSNPHGMRIEEL